jgi:tRNA-specific 2-thiouridylase
VPSNADNENFVVSGKEFEANRLIVAFDGPNAPGLWGKRFAIDNLSHISEAFPEEAELLAKPRYRDPSEKIAFRKTGDNSAEITFETPQRALAPGQVVALYEGERLLGGGFYRPSHPGRADLPLGQEVSA